MRIRTVIVDRATSARQKLRRYLRSDPDIRVVGEASTGSEAVRVVRACRPALMFLDVQMPDMTGFDLLRAIGADDRPYVLFVTARKECALRAFEIHALEYVLKPFTAKRLLDAVAYAKRIIRLGSGKRSLSPDEVGAGLPPVVRLAARSGDRTVFVKVADVDFFEAEGNYIRVHTEAGAHLIRERLSVLTERLDPRLFGRLHRSITVNLDRAIEMSSLANGDQKLMFANGKTLTVHRTYRSRLLSLVDDR